MPNHTLARLEPVQWVELFTLPDELKQCSPGVFAVYSDWHNGLFIFICSDHHRFYYHLTWADLNVHGRFLDEQKQPCSGPVGACLKCRRTFPHDDKLTSCSNPIAVGFAPHGAEQHSADWRSYISKENNHWAVYFDGQCWGRWETRERAREVIRGKKVIKALLELGYEAPAYKNLDWTKERCLVSPSDFEDTCWRLKLDHNGERLRAELASLGWIVDPKGRPTRPQGRWAILAAGGLDVFKPA